jgi:hypothetical protein
LTGDLAHQSLRSGNGWNAPTRPFLRLAEQGPEDRV